MQDKPETFTYTYSAEEQAEMRRIRSKYLPPEQTLLDRLRQLDRSATRRPFYKKETSRRGVPPPGRFACRRGRSHLYACRRPWYNKKIQTRWGLTPAGGAAPPPRR